MRDESNRPQDAYALRSSTAGGIESPDHANFEPRSNGVLGGLGVVIWSARGSRCRHLFLVVGVVVWNLVSHNFSFRFDWFVDASVFVEQEVCYY